MRRHPEDDLQAACVQWYRLQYPNRIIFAIPNGGKRNAREAARLKKQGVTAGVPDLFIPEIGHFDVSRNDPKWFLFRKHGLFVELKVGRNKVTEAQQTMIDELRVRNYEVHVCYSLDKFIEVVQAYLDCSLKAQQTE